MHEISMLLSKLSAKLLPILVPYVATVGRWALKRSFKTRHPILRRIALLNILLFYITFWLMIWTSFILVVVERDQLLVLIQLLVS